MFWSIAAIAVAASLYVLVVIVNLLSEANMAFGVVGSQKQGIDKELTAREHRFSDTALTARQISTMILIAEDVASLPSNAGRPAGIHRILVEHLNAASMTLGEYRYVRSCIDGVLAGTTTPKLGSEARERLDIVLPRFRKVSRFFTERLDSTGLTSTF